MIEGGCTAWFSNLVNKQCATYMQETTKRRGRKQRHRPMSAVNVEASEGELPVLPKKQQKKLAKREKIVAQREASKLNRLEKIGVCSVYL
jgi:hypothetical protein